MSKVNKAISATTLTAAIIGLTAGACNAESKIGTAEDREALFEYLVSSTMEREAFSPIKNERLQLDVEQEMRALKAEIVGADNEEELFYALSKLSNARRDRHLYVWGIEGGLTPPANYPENGTAIPVAPVRVEFDYSRQDELILFISDVAIDPDVETSAAPGDRLLAVNGTEVSARFEAARPYFRYSTELGYRKKFAEALPTRTGILPPRFYSETLDLVLQRTTGDLIEVSLPYLDESKVTWASEQFEKYPGFELVADRGAFDFYISSEGKPVILLDWHRFNEYLVGDIDWLLDYAHANQLLDHHIIWDGTSSGGGSRGAYAIQRLSPKPFKTTFGNLRISEVIPQFIEDRVRRYEERRLLDSGVPETIDDGTWLIEWLTDDVRKAYEAGQAFTNNVPFKLAHAPKYSDGILHPAELHFRGNMVCLIGPHGGSHLDQFVSIVSENDLCTTVGMQTGGYSNTWEWEEEVAFPTTGRPVIGFMWNLGHTISPSGRILEGDPNDIDDYLPLTRENFATYTHLLVQRALTWLLDQ